MTGIPALAVPALAVLFVHAPSNGGVQLRPIVPMLIAVAVAAERFGVESDVESARGTLAQRNIRRCAVVSRTHAASHMRSSTPRDGAGVFGLNHQQRRESLSESPLLVVSVAQAAGFMALAAKRE